MTWDAPNYTQAATPQVNWAQELLKLAPQKTTSICDAGCGTGLLTGMLLEKYPEAKIEAVDILSSMVEQAKIRLSGFTDRLSFTVSDLCQLDRTETYDLIASNAVIHWIPEKTKLYSRIFQNLHPQGSFIAMTTNYPERNERQSLEAMRKSSKFREFFKEWKNPFFFSSIEEIKNDVEKAGFQNIQVTSAYEISLKTSDKSFSDYVRTIILRPYSHYLPTQALKDKFFQEYLQYAIDHNEVIAYDKVFIQALK